MAESISVASSFQFISYKIDEFNFEMSKSIGLLSFNGVIESDDWIIDINLKEPTLVKNSNSYIGGVACQIRLAINDEELATLTTGISGIFKADSSLKKEAEESLVKYQIPTILLPYLRTTVTTFLANAGFGTFIFPLINITQLAQDQLKDYQITTLAQE